MIFVITGMFLFEFCLAVTAREYMKLKQYDYFWAVVCLALVVAWCLVQVTPEVI